MGEILHHSTYRPLTPEECANLVEQDFMKTFLWTAENRWGMHLAQGQLVVIGIDDTPDPEPYVAKDQTRETFPTLKEEVTLEAGDKYIQASIMFPCGNTYACRTVVNCKHDAKKNVIGQVSNGSMTLSLQMVKSIII